MVAVQLVLAAISLLAATVSAGTPTDALRVRDAEEIAFAIADTSAVAEAMGIDEASLAASVRQALGRAGLKARPTLAGHDEAILLVDVLVDGDVYYASAGFWRVASYGRPDGGTETDFVTVWQDYSVGVHRGNGAAIRAAITAVVERFVHNYRRANGIGDIGTKTAARRAAAP